VTLAPEGGAHQSIITPSVGLEQPRCVAWEPAFTQDLEWMLLKALSQLGRHDGTSAYFRLSTRPYPPIPPGASSGASMRSPAGTGCVSLRVNQT
jgi:pyruvate dehydrogenase E1 component